MFCLGHLLLYTLCLWAGGFVVMHAGEMTPWLRINVFFELKLSVTLSSSLY